MIATALKCDSCGLMNEMRGKDATQRPEGWATIAPMVRISGTPHSEEYGKDFRRRRDKLKELIQPMHMCPDCVEELATGKKSIKLVVKFLRLSRY